MMLLACLASGSGRAVRLPSSGLIVLGGSGGPVKHTSTLALAQVHHGSRLSDSREDGEALSSVHSTALAAGKLIHNLLCDGRVM